MTPLRVAVAGCGGRMGLELIRLIAADPELQLAAALTRGDDPLLGRDAGAIAGIEPQHVLITHTCDANCDVLVEFSSPAGLRAWARFCQEHRIALVSGTTGLGSEEQAALQSAATHAPVVWAPNMSVGVNLLLRLVTLAAETLGADWDVEIVETHHNAKVDAPSGTARTLLDTVCAARGVRAAATAVEGRSGAVGARPRGQVGVHAVRMGRIVGEHDVHFASDAEVVTLRHRALSRSTFAAGALRAAKWATARPPGLYTMQDVLTPPGS